MAILELRRFIQGRATLLEERVKFQGGKHYTAEEYLGVIRVRRSTELRDKVFAGAALFTGGVPSSVDYRSTTMDIFTAFSAERLWPEVGISSLSLVGGTVSDVEGLPSWVPDLGKPVRPEPFKYCGCPPLIEIDVADRSNFTITGRELRFSAAKWDSVKAIGEGIWSWTKFANDPYNRDYRLKMRTSTSAADERFGLMFSLLETLGSSYAPTGERMIDALWQTLIGGITKKPDEDLALWRTRFQYWFAFILCDIRSTLLNEKNHSGNKLYTFSGPKTWMVTLIAELPKLEERVSTFLDRYDKDIKEIETSELGPLRKTIAQISKRIWGAENLEQVGIVSVPMMQTLASMRAEDFYELISVFGEHFETIYDGRRIFTTENGFLGTGNEGVKAGDIVVLVKGADMPYIIRTVTGKEDTFTLVGEAYIHGIPPNGYGEYDFKNVCII